MTDAVASLLTAPPEPAAILSRGRQEVLVEHARTRVRRIWLPGDAGSVICKESFGPDSVRRTSHEIGILERLAGVAGVARLAQVTQPDAIVLADDGGVALAEVIRSQTLDVASVVAVALQLSRTIAAMHARGVVHKDISPSNVLLTGAGERPVLIDFDLANTFAVDRPGFVHQRDIVGTLAYLPPEQTGRTGLPVDHRADLYALGATLYEVIAGRPPFAADDELQLIRDILVKMPTPLAEWHRSARAHRPLGVAMIDIDFFKPYNDHYGHVAGDACLRRVAETLAAAVRADIDVVCRYGGEEFVIVIPEADAACAMAVGERACHAVAELKLAHLKGATGTVTVSVGTASTMPTVSSHPEALVKTADAALYRAKEGGRNQVRGASIDDAGSPHP